MTEQPKQVVEKVAAGLRCMNEKPDYFVFIPNGAWTWDLSEILGIPVIHCRWQFLNFRPYSDIDCPFLPCWREEKECESTYQFGRGYCEGGIK